MNQYFNYQTRGGCVVDLPACRWVGGLAGSLEACRFSFLVCRLSSVVRRPWSVAYFLFHSKSRKLLSLEPCALCLLSVTSI